MTDNRGNDPLSIRLFRQLSDQWIRAWRHGVNSSVSLAESALEANQAYTSAFGGWPPIELGGKAAAPLAETVYEDPEWSFERSVDTFDEIRVGDTVSFTKRIGHEDVEAFARVSGDTNRLHLDDGFAEQTRFGGRIVHGTLLSGLISAAMARLPGVTIYLSQDLEFRRPVDIGTTVTADCEIIEDLDGGKYRLDTRVYNESDEPVIDGEAVVLIDELPD